MADENYSRLAAKVDATLSVNSEEMLAASERICGTWRTMELRGVNPGSPRLLALLRAGATESDIEMAGVAESLCSKSSEAALTRAETAFRQRLDPTQHQGPAIDRPVSSDLRNMERLRDVLCGHIVFSELGGMVWRGTYWAIDTAAAEAQGHQLADILYGEVGRLIEQRQAEASPAKRGRLDTRIRALTDAAARAEGRHTIDNALALLKREMRVDANSLDRDPLLFNVINGTINLRDGTLRQHSSADWITKCAPVSFDPAATCPTFLRFMDEVFSGNAATVAYMRRFIGYCLTGLTREHVLAVWHGNGANGKSTLVNVLLELLGEYGAPLDVSVLELGRGRDASRDALQFFGRRLLLASESREGMRLREGFVKQATGGDKLTGRALYHEVFGFVPTHKLVLVTNHRPAVEGGDDAIWRRIGLVPFRESFVGERADTTLLEKLRLERSGILNWAIEGCLEWQAEGLRAPTEVLHATLTYRSQEDVLGQFLDEAIVADPRRVTRWRDIYEAYGRWCRTNGYREMSSKLLGNRLREQWGERAFSKDNGNRAIVKGYGVRDDLAMHSDVSESD